MLNKVNHIGYDISIILSLLLIPSWAHAETAQVVFLAESCNEPTYKKLVQGLALEKNVPLIDVSDNKQLGEWAGLCKIDKDAAPRATSIGTSD